MSLNDLLKNLKEFTESSDMKKDIPPPWVSVLLKGVEVMCIELQDANKDLKQKYAELKKEYESIRVLIDDQRMYCRRNYLLLHGISEVPGKQKHKLVIRNQRGEDNEIFLDLTKAAHVRKGKK